MSSTESTMTAIIVPRESPRRLCAGGGANLAGGTGGMGAIEGTEDMGGTGDMGGIAGRSGCVCACSCGGTGHDGVCDENGAGVGVGVGGNGAGAGGETGGGVRFRELIGRAITRRALIDICGRRRKCIE